MPAQPTRSTNSSHLSLSLSLSLALSPSLSRAHTRTGTGESGKSTFIKQMRIIHGQGYSKADRMRFKPLVYRNIVTSSDTLIQAMEQLEISYVNPDMSRHISLIRALNPDTVQEVGEEVCEAIRRVWVDSGVQECYLKRNQFQLSDSTK